MYKQYTDPNGNKYRILPQIWNDGQHNHSPITEEFVLTHGWTVEEKEDPVPPPVDDTEFKKACKQFRAACKEIGNFIGKPDFKGGFDEYSDFLNSEAAQTNLAKAGLLASVWAGANQYCKYEGSKIGYGQPEWWYKCWTYPDEELINI